MIIIKSVDDRSLKYLHRILTINESRLFLNYLFNLYVHVLEMI